MNYSLLSLMGLFLGLYSAAMDHNALRVLAAWTQARTAQHTTYQGLLDDGRKIEIEVCTKMRQTRNANPYELHYSGRIGKKRLTRAEAQSFVSKLQAAKQFTYVNRAALRPAKIKKIEHE